MLRIGLLGASRIAKDAVIKPASLRRDVEIVCVAARDAARAQAYAKEHDIAKAADSYAALLASPDVDLVYIGLPPGEHCEWTLHALKAGKHVLCEKPFAMHAVEAQKMVDVAADSPGQLIEAFHYRYHPMMHRIMSVLRERTIGAITNLEAYFNIAVPRGPHEFRYRRENGGGALMDLGCYPVHWARTVTGEEPDVIEAESRFTESFDVPPSEVDIKTSASLVFPSGATAQISCCMDETISSEIDAQLKIVGTEGEMIARNPLQPEFGGELIIRTSSNSVREEFSGATFPHQLDHVVKQLSGAAPPLTGGQDAVANMRVIDAIQLLAQSDRSSSS
jgi:predicted dehydrogenase